MTDIERHHAAIWATIDSIAKERGLTPSGLARMAGLDATVFNRSKRTGRNGPRWLSAETIAIVLAASGTTWVEFGQKVDDE